MNQDLQQAEQLMHNERRLLRRFARSVLAIMAMHTLLCVIYFQLGKFQLPWQGFIDLFAVVWAVLGVYLLVLVSGITLRLSEPSLSLAMMLLVTAMFMVTGYYVDELRLSVLTLYFAALLLASFRLPTHVMLMVACLASAGYALMLWLAFQNRGISLSFSVEAMQWLVFTMISLSFAITGGDINRLRCALSEKNRDMVQAVDKIREMAIRDDLTGLFNRRHLMEILERQKALYLGRDLPFAICYVDLDHFKLVNDRYGHDWGDRVLRRFSEMAMACMRDGDYFGRLGGEEFLLILPQSNAQGALQVAERLRKCWRQEDFSQEGGPDALSLSVGVADYRQGEAIDTLINRADQGLYRAKSAGRDRSQVA